MKPIVAFLSGQTKAIPAVIAALAFVGIAFLPPIFGQHHGPTVNEKGKIQVGKAEETKNANAKMKEGDGKEKAKNYHQEEKNERLEIRSLHATRDGRLIVGGKHLLLVWREGRLASIEGFPGEGVKGMASTPEGVIFVASKSGLHRFDEKHWSQLHDQEGEAVAVNADGTLFFAGKKSGLLQSKDGGKSWQAVEVTALPSKP